MGGVRLELARLTIAIAIAAIPAIASANDARLDGLRAAFDDPDVDVRLHAMRWLAAHAGPDHLPIDEWAPALANTPGLRALPTDLLREDLRQQDFYTALGALPALADHFQPEALVAAGWKESRLEGEPESAFHVPITVRPLALSIFKHARHPTAETKVALLKLLGSKSDSTGAAFDAVKALGSHYASKPDITSAFLRDVTSRKPVLRLLASGWPAFLDNADVIADKLWDRDPETVRLSVAALHYRLEDIDAARLSGIVRSIEARDRALSLEVLCGLIVFVATDADAHKAIARCIEGDEQLVGVLVVGSRREDRVIALLESIEHAKRFPRISTSELVQLMHSVSPRIRASALRASSVAHDPDLLPVFVTALRDTNGDVYDAALDAIAGLGAAAETATSALLQSGREDHFTALARTLQAISPSGDELPRALVEQIRSKVERIPPSNPTIARNIAAADPALQARMAPFLRALLIDDRAVVRQTAVALADGVTLTPEQLVSIAELVQVPQPNIEVVDVLASQGPNAARYAHHIEVLLEGADAERIGHAIKALDAMHTTAGAQHRLAVLVNSHDALVGSLAVKALGYNLGASLDAVVGALSDTDRAAAAITALTRDVEIGRTRGADFVRILRGDELEASYFAAAGAVLQLAPLDDVAILRILQLAHEDSKGGARYRCFAFLASGGRAEAVWYIRWLGRPPRTPNLADADRLDILESLAALLRPADKANELVKEIGDRIETIAADGSFGSGDIERLEHVGEDLERVQHPAAQRIANIIASLRINRYTKYGGLILAAHLLLWTALIVMYPRSQALGRWMFWNPWIRKLGGLGYVHFASTYMKPLRNRLLAPFQDRFREDAFVSHDDSGEPNYYGGSMVERVDGNTRMVVSLSLAIPSVRGRVVLEGESGLGKSAFLRRLVRTATKPTVYLPADRCTDGVFEAVLRKCERTAADRTFLKTLIEVGALDLCIDGLNEVTAETRATITQFVHAHPKANVILATQALLDWRPPGVAFRLLPLEESKSLEFLTSRYQDSDRHQLSRDEFGVACKAFMAAALVPTQDAGLLTSLRTVLSNPMDLTVVAEMILARKQPDLLRLQEQQYGLAAARYRRSAAAEFPLARFSEHIYQMRARGDSEIPANVSELELAALVGPKMIFSRDARDGKRSWFFRHDKVMEFFVLQTFLDAKDDRAERHFDDPRFRGVYFLLAMHLPLHTATLLRDQLVVRAAKSNDHTVSDQFVQLLESRKLTNLEGPKWLDRYESPEEARAKQKLLECQQQSDEWTRSVEDARSHVISWFECRSILAEPTEERLLEKTSRLIIRLGAEQLFRTADSSICRFEAPRGTPYVLMAATAATALNLQDVRDALELTHLARGVGDPKLMLVVNVMPTADPTHRTTWVNEGAEAELRAQQLVCVTTLALVEALITVQNGGSTTAELWSSIHDTAGSWRLDLS